MFLFKTQIIYMLNTVTRSGRQRVNGHLEWRKPQGKLRFGDEGKDIVQTSRSVILFTLHSTDGEAKNRTPEGPVELMLQL